MVMAAEAFEVAYRSRDRVFGRRPDRMLAELVEERGLTGRALDLGAGDGRNSFYLARRGLCVDALEVSPRAVRELQAVARREGLAVWAQEGDVRELGGGRLKRGPSGRGGYDLIVADTVLCHLEREEAREAAEEIVALMRPGGWLYASAFATDDPRESEFAPLVQSYFAMGEFCGLFGELAPVRCGETSLVDHRHGPAHRHVLLQVVARKE
jgi:SAM-dependent methyltransferase